MAISPESQRLSATACDPLTTVSKSAGTPPMADASTAASDVQSNMKGSDASLYDTLPLDRSKSEFRLWRFCTSGGQDTKLELVMEVFSTANSPPYISLSYEWCVSVVFR